MRRAYYSSSISDFLNTGANAIIGELTRAHNRTLEQTQLSAWLEQINILKRVLINRPGRIYFEYAIPRMGKRIDVVLLIGPVIFVLEFKVGESHFTSSALDQVTDYCPDLKNFHESSYDCVIAPILIATASHHVTPIVCTTPQNDKLLAPICSTVPLLVQVIEDVLRASDLGLSRLGGLRFRLGDSDGHTKRTNYRSRPATTRRQLLRRNCSRTCLSPDDRAWPSGL
jgi:hypothetical protein